jgi:hypothetical protein
MRRALRGIGQAVIFALMLAVAAATPGGGTVDGRWLFLGPAVVSAGAGITATGAGVVLQRPVSLLVGVLLIGGGIPFCLWARGEAAAIEASGKRRFEERAAARRQQQQTALEESRRRWAERRRSRNRPPDS